MGLMAIIEKYSLMALVILLGIVLVALSISRYQIANLEGQLNLSKQQNKELIDNNVIFQQKLQQQNQAVEELRKEADANKAKYMEDLKKIQPTIKKHEDKIKAINSVTVTSDECKDLQNIIDQARANDV